MPEVLQHHGPAVALETPAQIHLDAKLARCYTALSNRVPSTPQVGAVMIQDGTLLPDGVAPKTDRYTVDWSAVRALDGFALDRKMRSSGWNFFLIAGDIKAVVLGSEGNKSVRKAMIRLLAAVRSRRFNAAEITAIGGGRFLGIPYTAVTVQARHIQQSNVLQDAVTRGKVQWFAAWPRAARPSGPETESA